MNQIFLSYRREDSADVSGRINDRLAQHFGQDAIFTDVDSIPLGIDFQQYIDEQVGKCDIFLAVIGRDWLSVTDADGRHRLHQPEDFVRIEVESALRRKIPVIPLLVRQATMPSSDDMPDSLNDLATRNGMPIRPNPDFHGDMKRLISGIEQHLSGPSGAAITRKVDEERQRAEMATEARHQAEEKRKRAEAEQKRQAAQRKATDEKVSRAHEKSTREAEEKEQLTASKATRRLEQEKATRERKNAAKAPEEQQRQADIDSEQASSQSSKLAVPPGFGIRNIFITIFLIAMVPGLYLWDQQQSENGKENIYQRTLDVEQEEKRIASLATEFVLGSVFQESLSGGGKTPKMVVIPAGSFMMGSPETEASRGKNEGPQHEVKIRSFALGKYEVTFAEYDAFAEATGREKPDDSGWGRGRRPVINVSWDDALAYAQWLSEQSGQQYRLPTEAEWEYATRAGSTTAFWWGDTISTEQANYNGNYTYNNGEEGEYRAQTIEVGSFRPNPFGLYDVHGNVYEWSCSNYDESYAGGETQCVEPGAAGRRVLRGGSWFDLPFWLRSAYRFLSAVALRDSTVGFRLARVIP